METVWDPGRLGILLKEWQQNWGVAASCLESLRPIIGLQPATTADTTARTAASGLFQQVPCTALLVLAQARKEAAPPSIDLPAMQTEYIVLQEAARALQGVLTGMQACYHEGRAAVHQTSMQQESLSGQQETYSQHVDSQFQEPEVELSESKSQEGQQILAGIASAASNAGHADLFPQQQPAYSQVSSTPATTLGPEEGVAVLQLPELLVLLGELCTGYQRQLQMLALICGSLNLTTPQAVLDTYITFVKLEPFTDERVARALQVQLDLSAHTAQ